MHTYSNSANASSSDVQVLTSVRSDSWSLSYLKVQDGWLFQTRILPWRFCFLWKPSLELLSYTRLIVNYLALPALCLYELEGPFVWSYRSNVLFFWAFLVFVKRHRCFDGMVEMVNFLKSEDMSLIWRDTLAFGLSFCIQFARHGKVIKISIDWRAKTTFKKPIVLEN